jgi:prophage regulatory protein
MEQELEQLLSIRDVTRITSLDHNTIWVYRKEGTFPEPIQLGKRRVAWTRSSIVAWLKSKGVVAQ